MFAKDRELGMITKVHETAFLEWRKCIEKKKQDSIPHPHQVSRGRGP